jgi:N-acyl homoserine lactone hydrolase
VKATILKAVLGGVLCAASAWVQAQDIKLWQVSSGQLDMDKGWLTAMKDVGTRVKVPVAMYIIKHPRGLVVFDTGTNVATADGGCDAYWGKGLCGAFTVIQKRDEVIDRQLQKLGFKVEDVTHVVYSHFHLDHAGNIKLFPKAKHVVQKIELKTAWWPEKFQSAAYVLKDYDGTRDFDFMQLDGDFDLFGDGSMVVLDTKGHTQGHQSLQVTLKKTGVLLLAADAIYTVENENGAIPGITWNTNESMRSIDRLKQIRDAKRGQIWYSHGAEQYNANKHDSAYE